MDYILKIGNHSHLIKKGYNLVGSEITESKVDSIKISNSIVSKKHAIIKKDGDKIEIIDLCSDSGTRFGDFSLTPMVWYTVKENQIINFGFIEAKLLPADENDDIFVPSSQVFTSDMFSSRMKSRRLKYSLSADSGRAMSCSSTEYKTIPSTQDMDMSADTEMAFGYSKSHLNDSGGPETSVFIPETQFIRSTEKDDSELINFDEECGGSYEKQLESQNMFADLDYEPSYIQSGRMKGKIDMVTTFAELVESDDDELSQLRLGEKSYESKNQSKSGSATPDIALPSTSESAKIKLDRSVTPEIELSETPQSAVKNGLREGSLTPDLPDEKASTPTEDLQMQFDDSSTPLPRKVLQAEIATQIFDLKPKKSIENAPTPSSSRSVFDIETQPFFLSDFKMPQTRKQVKLDQNLAPKSRKSVFELNKEMHVFDTETQPLLIPDELLESNGNKLEVLSDKENEANNTVFDLVTQPFILAPKKRLDILRTPTPELLGSKQESSSGSSDESGEDLDKDFCEMSTFRMEDTVSVGPKASDKKRGRKKKRKSVKKKNQGRNQILKSSSDEEDDERVIVASKLKPPVNVVIPTADVAGPSGLCVINEKTPEKPKSLLSQEGNSFDTPELLANFPTRSQIEGLDFDELNMSQSSECDAVVFNEISDDEEKEQNRIQQEKIQTKRNLMSNVKLLKFELEANEVYKEKEPEKPARNSRNQKKEEATKDLPDIVESNKKETRESRRRRRTSESQKESEEKPKKSSRSRETRSKKSETVKDDPGKSTESSTRTRSRNESVKKTVDVEEKLTTRGQLKRQGSDRRVNVPAKKVREVRPRSELPTVVLKRSVATALKSFNIALSNLENAETMNKVKKLIQQLGGTIVEEVSEASILIIGGKINLTCKILSSISKGIPIVTQAWLEETLESGKLADTTKHIVKDQEHEKRYKYSLKDVLKSATRIQPLKNYNIIVTPSTKPSPPEMKKIIECAGAKYYASTSRTFPKDKNLLVVTEIKKDGKQCINLKEKLGSHVKFLACNHFIVNIILKQKLDFSEVLKI